MTVAASLWRESAAQVITCEDWGGGHCWLDVEISSDFATPAPGQFVQLRLPETRSTAFLPRPMSVARVRRRTGVLQLGFLFVPGGIGTRALAALPSGAEIRLLGPLGRGFPLDQPGTPLLIAGGRGVAPLLFAAEVLASARRSSMFLFGARTAELLVGLKLARDTVVHAGGRFESCTDDGSQGFAGDVVALLNRVAPQLQESLVIHACGPHGMLHAVARWGLSRKVPTYLAMESDMACGTGVCRGCPLPRSEQGRRAFGDNVPSLFGNREYAMCCTEGPVFEASDLDWERIE